MGYAERAKQQQAVVRQKFTEHQLLMACCSILNRGFFGRLKWLFLGK